MKKYFLFFLTLVSITCFSQKGKKRPLMELSKTSLDLAVEQYKLLDKSLPDTLFPRSIRNDGSFWMNRSGWWTSGFFPGSLWYLYEYSKDTMLLRRAIVKTNAVEKEKLNDRDHDIGFKMYCSVGNALRLTGDQKYVPILLTSAKTLTMRFDPDVKCIRSWGNLSDKKNPYLVIIDNMMNLELLFWATKTSKDSSYFKIAIAHADATMKNHFRPDGSSYHVVEYDPNTGSILKRRTAQGFSDESAWARGQAWGLYGYVMSYRETGFKRYLEQAHKIAKFILTHPNLPEDKIPYWDFNAPNIPDALRDASAGAIIASALLELSTLSDKKRSKHYLTSAEKMLESLSKDPYRASLGENKNFLIKHGVGNIPENSEVDAPLSYGDYYYVEALLRYRNLVKNKFKSINP